MHSNESKFRKYRATQRFACHGVWGLGLALLGSADCSRETATSRAETQAQTLVATGCREDYPSCWPACTGDNQQCVFNGSTCECVSACPQDAAQRVCSGSGPNQGCDPGFTCNAACACEERQTCLPDAPVCPGDGPNGGCAAGFACDSTCACAPEPLDLTARASRSSSIDISKDDALLAMVNADEGSVSFFDSSSGQETRLSTVLSSRVAADSEPMSVVLHPDGRFAYVANRATGSVSRINLAQKDAPFIDAETTLGGEPIGLALEPSGERLWVTNWVTGQVHVLDTSNLRARFTLQVGGNPWAIAVTNDGDSDSSDETVLVTQFYGRARAGIDSEGTDDGREGVVQVLSTSDPMAPPREITLAPVAQCFVSADQVASGCFPNQLLGINVHRAFDKTRAYVVSVAASPHGPIVFNHNVQALVSVIDLDTERELPALTTNLNELIASQTDGDGDETIGRRFINVPSAIDFVNRDDAAIGYVSSAGSDIVLRVVFNEDDSVQVGSQSAFNIPAGQNPSGLVITHRTDNAEGFTANLISRDVSVLALARQIKLKDVASTLLPQPGTAAFAVWRGKRFFNTSTGIWSKEGWGSCQGCHPLGLSDGVTWQFAAGPRQTIGLDGQYASDDPSDMRALNWTAIFDELDDFENNTRGTSGGTGAIRNSAGPISSATGQAFSAVPMEDGVTTENHQNLNGSIKFLTRSSAVCSNAQTCPDWDQIEAYVQSIRSARGKPAAAASISRGRAVYAEGGCDKCHAGPKWTISRTFYTPEQYTGELGSRIFEANRALTTPLDSRVLQTLGLAFNVNTDTTLLAGDDSAGGTPALVRQACNVRNVGTFGAPGGAAELRANQQPAAGRKGFNPPSLLGLATSAPYFHNGSAATVEALFERRFNVHLTAGNVNFIPTASQRADLAAFLRSIDERTPEFEIIPESIICPLDFSSF